MYILYLKEDPICQCMYEVGTYIQGGRAKVSHKRGRCGLVTLGT